MPKGLRKLSLFSKTIIVLVVTIILTAMGSFGFMYSEVHKVVAAQIKKGTEDTLHITNIQLQEKTVGGVSLLIALRTDDELRQALNRRVETPTQQVALSNQIHEIIRNAYYAIETPFKVAIVSAYGDVYANWAMVDPTAVLALNAEYHDTVDDVPALRNTLYTRIVPDLELSSTGNQMEDYYVQYMPLVSPTGAAMGLAMVLLPESTLYNMISFSQEDIHTTFLLDHSGNILSAGDKSLIGTGFNAFLESGGISDSHVVYSREAPRTRLMLADVMSDDYIEAQVWQIMRRMLLYTLLSITAIVIASYFLMHGITRPLKRLTQRIISSDYASFVEESFEDVGKNEISLLEHGFDMMEEDIRTLLALRKQEEKEKRVIEIAALQSQIQPHFLFNTLNTVRCSILNHHDEKAADLIYDLTALLRMTLVNGDELITLEKEVEAVRYYLEIIRMRYGTSFTVTTELGVDTAQLYVPKLLLQPLVENCVIHGFKQMKNNGVILIESLRKGEDWLIRIKNNGEPVPAEIVVTSEDNAPPENIVTRDSFSGIGLKNVGRRLKLYYGESSLLRIYTAPDGFTISEIRVPYPKADSAAPAPFPAGALKGEFHDS